MSLFCAKCGFPLSTSGAFCSQCGAAATGGPAPAPPMPRAAAKSSPVLKIVIALVCLLAVGAFAAVGLGLYAAHRVKQAVEATAKDYGIDLPKSSPAGVSSRKRKYRACEMFTKEEAAQALGEPIERTAYEGDTCLYYGPPGLAAKLAQQRANDVLNTAQNPDPQNKNVDPSKILGQMVSAASGVSGEDGAEATLLRLGVEPDARAQYTALQASGAIFSGIPGMQYKVPNLGDGAIRLANLGLNVLKGDTVITVIPGPVPGREQKSEAIARIILGRL